MAIFHFSGSLISRSGGKSCVASAAYRARELLRDERLGETFDYSVKGGLALALILAPEKSPEWVSDRSSLWNEVERVEKRKDAQLAREFNIALPFELTQEQMRELALTYVQEQFIKLGMIADVCFHDLDSHNPHFHVMLTLRNITPDGFGLKNRDWNSKDLLKSWREKWAQSTNAALEKAGFDQRIDHRSLAAKGLSERIPQVHLGPDLHKLRLKYLEEGNLQEFREKYQRGDLYESIEEANDRLEQVYDELEKVEQEIAQTMEIAMLAKDAVNEVIERKLGKRSWSERFTNSKEELDRFKTEIDLVEYIQNQGYDLDRRKSSKRCVVLTDNAGDKVLVGIDASDRHYFYTSLVDDKDHGSIIDFVQKRKNLNLGEVRKELRSWLAQESNPSSELRLRKMAIPKLTPVTKERYKVIARFETFETVNAHLFLNERGITEETLASPLFRDKVYQDERGNVIFPHRDLDGLSGYEIRNRNFKGFSDGGTRGLWHSNLTDEDTRLVICESPIDCMSYHQLFKGERTRYFATGGTLSEAQEELIKRAFEKIHQRWGEIIIATDNDAAGEHLAAQLAAIFPQGCTLYRHKPEHHKDWNEVLQAQSEPEKQNTGEFSFPSAQERLMMPTDNLQTSLTKQEVKDLLTAVRMVLNQGQLQEKSLVFVGKTFTIVEDDQTIKGLRSQSGEEVFRFEDGQLVSFTASQDEIEHLKGLKPKLERINALSAPQKTITRGMLHKI